MTPYKITRVIRMSRHSLSKRWRMVSLPLFFSNSLATNNGQLNNRKWIVKTGGLGFIGSYFVELALPPSIFA